MMQSIVLFGFFVMKTSHALFLSVLCVTTCAYAPPKPESEKSLVIATYQLTKPTPDDLKLAREFNDQKFPTRKGDEDAHTPLFYNTKLSPSAYKDSVFEFITNLLKTQTLFTPQIKPLLEIKNALLKYVMEAGLREKLIEENAPKAIVEEEVKKKLSSPDFALTKNEYLMAMATLQAIRKHQEKVGTNF